MDSKAIYSVLFFFEQLLVFLNRILKLLQKYQKILYANGKIVSLLIYRLETNQRIL